MFLIYSLLFTVGLLLAAPYYLWRLRGNLTRGAGWRERFGFLPQSFEDHAGRATGSIWIHAVSVGETLAVTGLVQELKRRHPERRILMSHVTPAGRQAGDGRLPAALAASTDGGNTTAPAAPVVAGRFFLPLDWAWSTRRVVARIHPALLVIVETELWPNLLRSAHRFGARVVLVNARLSDQSFRGYRLARPFMRRVLENVDGVCAQTPADAERFELLGSPAGRVVITGNIKFDGRAPERGALPCMLEKALGAAPRAPIIVAGSTMAGEEEMVLDAWRDIRRSHPQGLLILAPRHPARFEYVAQLLARSGLRPGVDFVRRTALATGDEELAHQMESPEILLLDTIGELAGVFELADVAFVGGSLVAAGGHNVLEPAFWAKPILFGPHMENFRDIARLFLEAGAAIQVESAADLARQALRVLADHDLATRLGQAARRVLDAESGATLRVLDRLDEELSRAGL